MLVYVDDIIVIGSSPIYIQILINKLNTQFQLKQHVGLEYFLEIKAS